jgi:CHAT domain
VDDPDAPAATGKGRFLGEMGLCRWLRGAPNTDHIVVRAGKARYVVPAYPGHLHLSSAAGVELPMLKGELHAKPIPATHDGLLKALRQPGSFDLLHFAGHGRADMADANAAELLLEGERLQTDAGVALTKEALRAGVVANEANLLGPDGNRPMVVINACQAGRGGYALSGLGGFAPAFLGVREGVANTPGRAGAFIGALWSVGDRPASDFVIALYRALKDGKTMAQASAMARCAARDAGEGTWLAYTVYAHPHLLVLFG